MKNDRIKLAIVGVGKIVQDQHLPAIEKSGAFDLIATASRNGTVEGVNFYTDIETMLTTQPEVEAVSLCMPPQFRFQAAQIALKHGVDVLLEKPPGATICEVDELVKLATQNDCRLYTTWHSRHAAAVESAKSWLAENADEIDSISIRWKEDVRKWHPGQEWIWQAGGMGVFDPGINGLSILTHILPMAFFVERAELMFPDNKDAPIAADIDFRTSNGVLIDGEFDWLVSGDEHWMIQVIANGATLDLVDGGARLFVDGVEADVPEQSKYGEYESIYAEFVDVVNKRRNAIDLQPLKLVADAFLLGKRTLVKSFEE